MKSRFATIWMDNPPPPASARSTLSAAGCSRIYMAHLAPGRGDWSKVLQLVDPNIAPGLVSGGQVRSAGSRPLRVRKPADAVLNTAAWQGDAAPPLEPPASRAGGGAADGRGTPPPEARRECARA